jgi:envelope integrity protein B
MVAVTKLSRIVYLLTGLTFLLPAAWTLGSIPADAAEILPHKAFYILHSQQVPGGAESVSADGLLIFEWTDTCDGWQVNQRAKIRLSGEDGDTGFEWRQITWESKDGRRYRYQTEELHDGEKGEQRRGEASFDPGGPGAVTTALPERSQHPLSSDVLLPTAHSLHLLRAAEAGESFMSAEVFDGTVSDEPMQITAAMGPSSLQWQDQEKKFPALAKVPSRPVDLAFFLTDNPAGEPDFEQSLRVYDNGVIGRMTFTFAGVSMAGELSRLDVPPPAKCKAGSVVP